MKKITVLSFLLLINTLCFAQWEYKFFSLRVGMNHNSFSPKPGVHPNKFQSTPEGDMKFTLDDKYMFYSGGFTGDLLFHYDMKTDKLGFVTGLEYSTNSIGARYASDFGGYQLTEKYKVTSIGFPLQIKFGHDIYRKMSYFFIGAQYNFNIGLTEYQQASWSGTDYVGTKNKEKLNPLGFTGFVGYNYYFLNFEMGMMPGTFLNTGYTAGDTGLMPLSDQGKNILYFKTSLNIPLSEWLMSKSWALEKMRRKFARNL